jgi:hypothetical protein
MNILRSQIQMIYEYQQPVELMLGGLSLGRQGKTLFWPACFYLYPIMRTVASGVSPDQGLTLS